jgi:hypothetical protein
MKIKNIYINNKMDLPKMKTDDLEKELIDKYKKKQSQYDRTKIFKKQR